MAPLGLQLVVEQSTLDSLLTDLRIHVLSELQEGEFHQVEVLIDECTLVRAWSALGILEHLFEVSSGSQPHLGVFAIQKGTEVLYQLVHGG